MEMTAHEFTADLHAKSAEDMETAAAEAVTAYFGPDLTGVTWNLDVDTMRNLAGGVISYVGRVHAVRG